MTLQGRGRPRKCAPQHASNPMTHAGSVATNFTTPIVDRARMSALAQATKPTPFTDAKVAPLLAQEDRPSAIVTVTRRRGRQSGRSLL